LTALTLHVPGTNVVNLGSDLTTPANAGLIGYQTASPVGLSVQGQGCLGYASRQTNVNLEQRSSKGSNTIYLLSSMSQVCACPA